MNEVFQAGVDAPPPVTTTEAVFDAIYQAVITLRLPPGAKVSEADIARQFEVSRQPVRDAFFRLSKLGFLAIRPQRATLITKISRPAVLQAVFVRTALERACLDEAIAAATPADDAALQALIDAQQRAVDAGETEEFFRLDDAFHHQICKIAGRGHVWTLIREQKAHMDRVRYLTLPSGSQRALDEHVAILAAFVARDRDGATALLRAHLGRLHGHLERIAAEHRRFFEDAPG